MEPLHGSRGAPAFAYAPVVSSAVALYQAPEPKAFTGVMAQAIAPHTPPRLFRGEKCFVYSDRCFPAGGTMTLRADDTGYYLDAVECARRARIVEGYPVPFPGNGGVFSAALLETMGDGRRVFRLLRFVGRARHLYPIEGEG